MFLFVVVAVCVGVLDACWCLSSCLVCVCVIVCVRVVCEWCTCICRCSGFVGVCVMFG